MRTLLCILILVFTACNSTKKLRTECKNCQPLDTSMVTQLEGNYKSDLWGYIAPFKKLNQVDTTDIVKLEVINRRRLKASLIKNGTVIATKTIKGEVKDKFFSVRPKVYPIGIPIIFFIWYSNKVDFTLTTEGELCMTVDLSKYGNALLFFQGGTTESYIKTYKKL